MDEARHQLVIESLGKTTIRSGIHHIDYISVDSSSPPSLYLSLSCPPSFEGSPPSKQASTGNIFDLYDLNEILSEMMDQPDSTLPEKLSCFDDQHHATAPYTSQHTRLLFPSPLHLDIFYDKTQQLKSLASRVFKNTVAVDRRNTYSPSNLTVLESWVSTLYYPLALQCHRLLTNKIIDPLEIIDLIPLIERSVKNEGLGVPRTIEIIRRFAHDTYLLSENEDDSWQWYDPISVQQLWKITERTLVEKG